MTTPSDIDPSHQKRRTKILGVTGSQRQDSHSTRTLLILLDIASDKYLADTQILNLRETILPLYNPSGRQGRLSSENVKKSQELVDWADAFILASPDYHGSMSGTMKNFLDHYWEEFAGKTFGYVCTSHEKGLTVMDQMRTAVRQCYGWSLPYGVFVNSGQDFDSRGLIVNHELSKRLNMLARDLTVYGKLIREQFVRDLNDHVIDTYAAHYR